MYGDEKLPDEKQRQAYEDDAYDDSQDDSKDVDGLRAVLLFLDIDHGVVVIVVLKRYITVLIISEQTLTPFIWHFMMSKLFVNYDMWTESFTLFLVEFRELIQCSTLNTRLLLYTLLLTGRTVLTSRT